jgi:hypothetical protein
LISDAPAARADSRRELLWRLAPVVAAVVVAAVYLVSGIRSGDLAAHVFRADLFGREGFTIWNGQWYGGHHTPAYSVLFPPLAWLLGPRVLGALAAVAAAALFEPLLRGHFGQRARWGALWFALATGTVLVTGRLPFMVGTAVGLGALLALQRGRPVLATAIAFVCPLASPVAGLFLAMAAAAYALSGLAAPRDTRTVWRGVAILVAALAPAIALAVAFPEGGYQPFGSWPFAAVPVLAAAAFLLLPPKERALRIGALLYGAGTVLAYAVHTPVGSNSLRVAELFAGPILLCGLTGSAALRSAAAATLGRRAYPAVVGVLLVGVAFWAVWPAVRDSVEAARDPAFGASYYRPLNAFLGRAGGPPGRVEVVFTKSHFEAAEVANRFPLARGWERQMDTKVNPLFYQGKLTPGRYARWLNDSAVRRVALSDAKVDFSAVKERRLVASPAARAFLKPVWRSRHWRVYEVRAPRALTRPGTLSVTRTTPDRVELTASRPGSAVVRVRFSPYWLARGGCVERAGDWTRVTARRAGMLTLVTSFAPARVVERGRRCA